MENLKALVKQMTVREKLAQMSQLSGESWNDGKLMGIQYGFGQDPDLVLNTGSILGVSGAALTKRLQQEHLEKSRHKIPLLFMTDVIHGYRTIFPSPLGMSCSFSPEMAQTAAHISAVEASASGLHVTFSPMADLVRDARWGRVIESTGEDPWLNGEYAAAFVRGYQQGLPGVAKGSADNAGTPASPASLAAPGRLACCVKHFAGYGAAESGRDYNTTEIGEYQLREFYLPAYKAALDAGCRMVMSGFNALNGVPCTANQYLFQEILRREWGFDGLVITDCTAVYELVPHGFCETQQQAGEASLLAGMDIEMVSTAFFDWGEKLLEEGRIAESMLDTAVERILQLKQEMGLFENPYGHASEEAEARLHLCGEHRQFARQLAAQSIVLLKNQQSTLPLLPTEKLAVLGPFANSKQLLDIWKCEGKEDECVSLAEGLAGRIGCQVLPCCGLDAEDAAAPTQGQASVQPQALAQLKAQVQAATEGCDKIVLALGEHPSMSAEAGSRAYLSLPQPQMELARLAFALGKPVIAIIFSGRPLELGEFEENAQAILQAWYPGTEGGNALADLLLGATEPTARLSISFPRTVGQLPLYYNALPTGRPMHGPSDTERFRSRYLDAPNTPLYPFGFGLGYTHFAYGSVQLSAESMKNGESLFATISLQNTGPRAGTETVQLYLRDMGGSCARPVRMLKGFQKIHLAPGEAAEVRFEITEEMLKYHTTKGYMAEPGDFLVFIGPHSALEGGARFTFSV